MAVRTRLLADGTIQFYDGRKIATKEQAKQFIKDNAKLSSPLIIPTDKLKDKDLRQYAGRVKGGVNRAKNSLVDNSGKFLNATLQRKALKQLGVNVDALMKAKDVDNIRELFKDQSIKKRFDKLMTTGVVTWLDYDDAADKLDSYEEKEILVNNEPISPQKASKKTGDILRYAKRNWDGKDIAIKFTFIGITSLKLFLPERDELEDYEDAAEFNEDWSSYVIVYASNPKDKKNDKGNKKTKAR